MTTITKYRSNRFYGALAATAFAVPALLVIVAGAMPEGLQRGELIVVGNAMAIAMLAAALVVNAAYAFGFSKALKLAAVTPNNSAMSYG